MACWDWDPGTSNPPDESTPWALPENGRATTSTTIQAATNHQGWRPQAPAVRTMRRSIAAAW